MTTTTVSTVLASGAINIGDIDMLRYWCSECADRGGSFSVETKSMAGDWYSIYTINWPDSSAIPEKPQ